MRPCQLCGACSWGAASLVDMTRFVRHIPLSTVDPNRCLKCDNCLSIALKSVIEEPTPSLVVEDPFTLGLTTMTAALKDSSPSRSNRTERLVHTLLRSDLLDTHEVDTADSIVDFARKIERALDALEEQESSDG